MKNMKKEKIELKGAGELRRKAEENLKLKPAVPEKLSGLEPQELIQELRVHQIELEMQNEELRKTQAVVEESRAKYSDLYDFAPVGYITLNRQGLILEANLTACSNLGKERSLLISIYNLFTNFIIKKGEKDLFYQHLKKVFETKSLETCELEIKGKDNTKFYAQLESIIVKDNLSQCRTAITDITERKKTEEALKKIDEMKTGFVSSVSHELRTPLTIIKQGIALVLDQTAGGINPEQKKFLEAAERNVDRLVRLINYLLDISKIEAQKMPINLREVDIVKAAEEIVNMFRSQADDKKINLAITKFPEKSFNISADPDMLSEIFHNLLSNALKFTGLPAVAGEQGRIAVEITESEDFGEVRIIDNGIGIAIENLPKVFLKFEQFGRVSGPGAKGTGLGLAITKGLVELQGGKIWIESELGKGSKFTFTIPKEKKGKED